MSTQNDTKQSNRGQLLTAALLIAVLLAGVWVALKHSESGQPSGAGEPARLLTVDGADLGITSSAPGDKMARPQGSNATMPGDPDGIEKLLAIAKSGGMIEQLEEAIHQAARAGDATVPQLKGLLQPGQNPEIRRAASRVLAEVGTPPAVATLLHAVLEEQEDEGRREMVSALHALTNPAAAPELLSALLTSQDPIIVSTVRDTFARLADDAATRAITKAYHEEANEGWQQSNLMGAIARERSPDSVAALGDILRTDSDFALCSQAAIALGLMGSPQAIQSLLSGIEQSSSPAYARVLIESLGSVNNKDSVNELAVLLDQGTNDILRSAAASALGNIHTQNTVSLLKNALQTETSAIVRGKIELSLGKLGVVDSMPNN